MLLKIATVSLLKRGIKRKYFGAIKTALKHAIDTASLTQTDFAILQALRAKHTARNISRKVAPKVKQFAKDVAGSKASQAAQKHSKTAIEYLKAHPKSTAAAIGAVGVAGGAYAGKKAVDHLQHKQETKNAR